MNLFRRNPVFSSVMLIVVSIGLGGLSYLSKLDRELDSLKTQYATKSAQYSRYVAATPSPTNANLSAISANYRSLYEVYDKTLSSLNMNTYDAENMFKDASESRADWSYKIHKYIRDSQIAAANSGVGVTEGSSFGVAMYERTSPAKEDMERVHRQIVIMSNILENLFDSEIESFVSIQRGVPVKSNRSMSSGADEFSVPKSMTIAVPNVIDALAFRVSFKGQSVALRSFLNRIVNSPLPYAVRSIEVNLARESGAKSELELLAANPFSLEQGDKRPEIASSVPIISDNSSLFVVTLEFLELAVDIAEPQDFKVGEGTDA